MGHAARGAALLVALAIVLGGCGSSTPTTTAPPTPAPTPSPNPPANPTPTSTPDPAAVYAQIEAQVEQLRGLRATRPVDPQVIDPATLRQLISQQFARDNPAPVIAASERFLKALGLISATASLRNLYLDLYGSQVAGFYDPETKHLYVLSQQGSLGPAERLTFAHEFDHALQDQNFGLEKLQGDTVGEDDRSTARLALVEGDATLLMSLWARQYLTPADLLKVAAASNDPQQAAILARMPAILRDSLLFPYVAGLQFVIGLQSAGGWAAVNAAFRNLPASTSQILHPERYTAHQAPIAISTPANLAARLGSGWTVTLTDTLGEAFLKVWLREEGKLTDAQATTAAAGWRGDRLVVAEGPNGAWAIGLIARWSTSTDAAAFATAARAALGAARGRSALIDPGTTTRVSLFVASDDAAISRLAAGLGLAG